MPIKFNNSSIPNTHKVYANGTRLGYIRANGTIVYHAQIPIKIENNSGTAITISSSANNVNQSISSGSTFTSNFFYDSNFTLSASELKYELTRDYNGSRTFPTWTGDSSKNIFYTTNAAYSETFEMSMNGLTLTLTKGAQITKVTKSSSSNTNGANLGIYYTNNSETSVPIYSNYTGQSLYVKSGTQLQLYASNPNNDDAYITTKSSSTYTILGDKLTSSMQKYAAVTLSGSSDTVFDNWYRFRYLGSILLSDRESKGPSCTMSGDSVYITTGQTFSSSAYTSYTFDFGRKYRLFDSIVGYATASMSLVQQQAYFKNLTLTISKTDSKKRAYRWTSSDISLGDESTFTFTSFTAKSTGSLRFGLMHSDEHLIYINTSTATDYATIYNGYTSYIDGSTQAPTTGFSSFAYCYRPFNSTIYLRDTTSYSNSLRYSKITFNNSTKTFHNGNGLSFTVGTSSYYSISRSESSIQVRMKCPDAGSGNWTATFFNNSDISVYVYYNTKKMKSSSNYNYSLGSFSLGASSSTNKTIYDVPWYDDKYIGANVWKYTVNTGTVTVHTITTGSQFTRYNPSSSYVNLT